MPLEAPNLDDRRFKDLFEELRSLIPRYAPEWTDHNLSDPGITMMQLFSYLGEIILFRLNRVPERNYIKFLQLIGVEQKAAAPARAEVTFTLVSPAPPTVYIPQGTQISAQVEPPPPSAISTPMLPPEPEEPVIFETDEPLIAIGAALAAIQVFDGKTFTEYTQANQVPDQFYPAFGDEPANGNALYLGFASDHPFPVAEVNLFVRVFVDATNAPDHRCDVADNQVLPAAIVAWEYWDGSDWGKLNLLKDETRSLTQTGHVYFLSPKAGISKRVIAPVTRSLYWIRCHLVNAQYEMPPVLDAVLTNTVRVTAVTTLKDEVLGSSNGQPNQVFRLRKAPIFAKPLRPVEERLRAQATRVSTPNEAEQALLDQKLQEQEFAKGFWLEVDEGDGAKPWEEVADFFNSDASDRHYLLNRTTGDVTFGDGRQGQIPLAGLNNIAVRYYRYGGGAKGNVGINTITNLQSPIPEVERTTNYWFAEGGADEESIQKTKARAPKELKARDRAVTLEDFAVLAEQTPGVRIKRAYALPLYNPQFPDFPTPGAVTVVVLPESKAPNPLPTEVTLQAVCAHLNQHRLLTTEVFVAPPKYVQVKIEATVVARPSANPAAVQTQIQIALNAYLNPLTGGESGLGWGLGEEVIYSEVFRRILTVDGVQRVDELLIHVEGQQQPPCSSAQIPAGYLVFSDGHDITVLLLTTV
ncbi:MAG: putative baseplate assembly protein [Scytolyngbya sp. HA4215-MV1]|jgi:predicted phage baseplate assembly protein|nr:putative baseplate assembly protein [Scytolyngbya sp. HA4215-MV1]